MRQDYFMWWLVQRIKRVQDKRTFGPDNIEYELELADARIKLPNGEYDRFTIDEQRDYYKELEAEGVINKGKFGQYTGTETGNLEDESRTRLFHINKQKFSVLYTELAGIYRETLPGEPLIYIHGKWTCSGDKIKYKKIPIELSDKLHALLKYLIISSKNDTVCAAKDIVAYMKMNNSGINVESLPTYKGRLNDKLSIIIEKESDFMTGSIKDGYKLRKE